MEAPTEAAEFVAAGGAGDSPPVLDCRKVSKSFAGVQALSEVTLNVGGGRIVGLIGPNGSGKTTLLNCISGVLVPDNGQVKVNGHDVTGRPPYVCASRGIARTFQNLRLFGSLSVRDNLLIGGHQVGTALHAIRRQRDRSERAARLLALLELGALEHHVAGSLAYGLQRRVEIARALMSEPAVLLLDEPAAGMNHVESEALGKTLRQLRGLGIGILLVEHNVALVTKVSDDVVVLDAGVELARGNPELVMKQPEVIKAYLG